MLGIVLTIVFLGTPKSNATLIARAKLLINPLEWIVLDLIGIIFFESW